MDSESSSLDPATAQPNTGKEGPVGDLVEGVKEKFSIYKKFWRTRRAILRGERLSIRSPSELTQAGLLPSWKFNLLQSGISAIPALLAGKFLDTIFPAPKPAGFQAEFESWASWTLPATLPFMLFMVAQMTGWASLKWRDQNPQTRTVARKTYLYLDGALGLYSQALLALGLSLESWHFEHRNAKHGEWSSILLGIGAAALAIGVSRQIFIHIRRIPQKLFIVNGYSQRLKSFWMLRDKGRNFGPLTKFLLVQAVAGWIALAGMSLFGYGIAALITLMVLRMRTFAAHY